MSKKIFVFESDNCDTLNYMNNIVDTFMTLNGDFTKCRKYDNISDAFASEYTDEFVDTIYKNEPDEYSTCFNSGIPIENFKNYISDNIKKQRYYETKITDAIVDDLCQLDVLLKKEEGIEGYNKMYEVKKDELGDSFLIFK